MSVYINTDIFRGYIYIYMYIGFIYILPVSMKKTLKKTSCRSISGTPMGPKKIVPLSEYSTYRKLPYISSWA